MGLPESKGKGLKQRFLSNFPALKALINDVQQRSAKVGWLPTLDGGLVPARSQHSALNTLLQSFGAVVAKKWIVTATNELLLADLIDGVHFKLVLHVHDELQYEIIQHDRAKQIGSIVTSSATMAGEHLGVRLPIAADYKIGSTWRETH